MDHEVVQRGADDAVAIVGVDARVVLQRVWTLRPIPIAQLLLVMALDLAVDRAIQCRLDAFDPIAKQTKQH